MKFKARHIPYYVFAVLFFLGIILYEGTTITVNRNKVNVIYGQKVPQLPSFSAHLYSRDISPLVRVIDHTNYTRVGEYTVDYDVRILGIPIKRVQVPSSVLDMDAPVLSVAENTICFSRKNADWSLPEYTVSDNYELSHNIEVTVDGVPDTSREGTYGVRLKACDTSGNCTMQDITMIVGDAAEEDFQPERFDLRKLDSAGVLLKPSEEEIDESIFRSVYWMGDSNVLNLGKYDGLPANRVMARYAMSPQSFELPLTFNNVTLYRNAVSMVRNIRPKRLLIMMGEAEAGNGDPVRLAEQYGSCLDELLEASPDTKIYVCSILPVRQGENDAACTMEDINRANYCLLQMCREKKIPMICPDEWLKDKKTGYGKDDYYLDDGYHLKGAYYSVWTNYVRQCITE